MAKFFTSICLLIKDENRYLEEWLDWHVSSGFEHFFIYDNGSQVPVASSIPDRYREMCSVVDFSGEHLNTQFEAYGDCLARFGSRTEWLAFIDTDEFIRIKDGNDINSFMAGYEIDHVLVIPWIVYNAGGQLTRSDGPVRERFTEVTDLYPKKFPRCKCIVRPSHVTQMTAHWPVIPADQKRKPMIVSEHHLQLRGPYDPSITGDLIVVDHYFTRSWEEWEEKAARGSCCPSSVRKYEKWFDLLNPGFKHPPLKK